MASIAALPPPPSVPLRHARAFNALAVVLLLILCWQLAEWTWHFIAPPAPIVAAPPATGAADPAAARRLFGDAAQAPANTSGSVRLKGVYAIDGKTLSAAVVNTGKKNDQAVRLGEDIDPGLTLAEVHADHIVVARGAVRERIDLEQHTAKAAPGKSGAAIAASGFRLTVANTGTNQYSLSRNELNTVLQDPRQLNYLGRIGTQPTGGVRLEQAPAGSLPEKLGLKEGDIVRVVNGQPVNSPGDLARVYQQFGTLSQIRAEVTRGGTPLVLMYQIQP